MIRNYLIILLLASCAALPLACAQETNEKVVTIHTTMGKIKVKLFNDTPLHRDNFLSHVEAQRYDSVLFHRVIKQFMIQAGEGSADPGYATIPAEIVYPKYFHKRGMLCAARMGDDVNPERASSATQFYIVTGKYFTEMELDAMEKNQGITLTPEQRQAYMLEGGAPHLDGKYTVFGEVVSGLKVVDKIQLSPTGEADRPVKEIRIKSMKLVKK
ncbi:MAG: peptidylprolyl isomerase [Tannerellaceae bacterium]|jgi:peptidylprolyl isomerase/peptidyl-prolyl cis-trans isomerase B (cyclophilin B)|nr:peptidylprolyl isomerase [Tannerellaceae bacterium]